MRDRKTYKQSMVVQNFQLGRFAGQGEYDIPRILPVHECNVTLFAGFGEETMADGQKLGCHFYLDDYRFERVWNSPVRYLPYLREYAMVLSPDYSLFTDYPKALQIYNHFRKHWCAAYWQRQGLTVIPTICWSDEKSFDWCFDGEPHNSVVSVSSTGVANSKRATQLFLNGYAAMEQRLHPSKVLWFGKYILPDAKENIVMCETIFKRRFNKMKGGK